MMTESIEAEQRREQRKIAAKYRLLGYDVVLEPADEALPAFMSGMRPDLVARSEGDNVVVEIRQLDRLKGSNEIVGIAERVSEDPSWRLELVSLGERVDELGLPTSPDLALLTERIAVAMRYGLLDLAFVYVCQVMMSFVSSLARRYRVPTPRKTDRALLSDLAFKGILPPVLHGECLAALAKRDVVSRLVSRENDPAIAEVESVLTLCEQLISLAS